jgi:hypothetical protein
VFGVLLIALAVLLTVLVISVLVKLHVVGWLSVVQVTVVYKSVAVLF